jgi:hypothetical protein
MQKTKYIRDRRYRKWLSTLPCIITGRPDTQVCHIRSGNKAGAGFKSCDSCCVPMAVFAHHAQHGQNEREFWKQYGGIEKATKLAKGLYENRYDDDKAIELITRWRRG